MSHPWLFRAAVLAAMSVWPLLVLWAMPGAVASSEASVALRRLEIQRIWEARETLRQARFARWAEKLEKRQDLNGRPLAAALRRRHLENLLAIKRAEQELLR